MFIQDLIDGFLDLLFPIEGCLVCNQNTQKHPYFCNHCIANIKFLSEDICIKCGKHCITDLCGDCSRLFRIFDKGLSVVQYNGSIPKIIHSLKYNNQRWIAKPLGEMMAKRIDGRLDIDVVIPVPLHKNRLSYRGYNQSLLLAKSLCHSGGYLLKDDILQRVKDTPSQNALNHIERKSNILNAFEAKEGIDLKGANILIVDDVFTTGSTINQCARALKLCNCGKIYFITFASGTGD